MPSSAHPYAQVPYESYSHRGGTPQRSGSEMQTTADSPATPPPWGPAVRRRRAVVRAASPDYSPTSDPAHLVPPPLAYEVGGELLFPWKPSGGSLVDAAASQVDSVASFVGSFLSAIFSLLSESKATAEGAPSRGAALLRRLGVGLLGAAYTCLVLLAALVVAVLMGVGLVRLWVEEPVSLRKPLYFDYTVENPSAMAVLGEDASGGARAKAAYRPVPPGHIMSVSLGMVLPESDYNRHLGIFQVTAQVISSSGDVMASSSQPCMLRFRSNPVRLVRTFMMGVPLVLGMSREMQKITVQVLKYKEDSKHKTEALRLELKPRAGTFDLPQLYEAEIVMKSQLPWLKEVAHNWKRTFYVWVSLYMYVMILLLLGCFSNTFGLVRRSSRREEPSTSTAVEKDLQVVSGIEVSGEFADALRKWRARSRRKRKTPFTYMPLAGEDVAECEASSMMRGDIGEVTDDSGDFPASESSGCVGG